MAEYSKYTGADATIRDVRKLMKFAPYEFGDALMEETKIEQKECIKETPKLTGKLQGDIKADGPFIDGRNITTTIHTTEETADYAATVHEDLDVFHPVGGAKFIERPLNESRPFLPARVAARVDLNKSLKK